MRPVRGTKSIVHKEIRQLGQLAAQLRIVLLFPGLKPGVLQQQYLTWLECPGGSQHAIAHDLVRLFHRDAQQFR